MTSAPTNDQKPVVPRARRYSFAWDTEVFTIWYPNLLGTQILNAYTLVFPVFERLMIKWVGEAARDIRSEELRARIAGFVAQEAGHAHQHGLGSELLQQQGYRTEGFTRSVHFLTWGCLDKVIGILPRRLRNGVRVAMCAAGEHWTTILATATLVAVPGGIPMGPMSRLYAWHGLEEIEHKSVVFDLLHELSPSYLLRLWSFLVWTACFVTVSGLGTLLLLLQLKPKYLFSWWLAQDTLGYLFTREAMFWHGVRGFFSYLKPSYHPDQYPTAEATRIAQACLDDSRVYDEAAIIKAAFQDEEMLSTLNVVLRQGKSRSQRELLEQLRHDAAGRSQLAALALADPTTALHMTEPLVRSPHSRTRGTRSADLVDSPLS